MSLFNWGDFPLSSGKRSPFKIDCNALQPQDWEALADLALCHLRPFSRVEGVPFGGLMLATFLSAFAQKEGGLLIVDDVFTTGRQIEELRNGRMAQGLVVFARAMPPPWIRPLFVLYEDVP